MEHNGALSQINQSFILPPLALWMYGQISTHISCSQHFFDHSFIPQNHLLSLHPSPSCFFLSRSSWSPCLTFHFIIIPAVHSRVLYRQKKRQSALVDERSQRSLHFPGSYFWNDGWYTHRERKRRRERKERTRKRVWSVWGFMWSQHLLIH